MLVPKSPHERERETSLSDALVAWAEHEIVGRCGGKLDDLIGVDEFRSLRAIMFLMSSRQSMLARIIDSDPFKTERTALVREHMDSLRTFDGRTVGAWVQTEVDENPGTATSEYVLSLLRSGQKCSGYICCLRSSHGETTVFDGTHRLGAWYLKFRRGQSVDPLPAYLIHTRKPVLLFS